MAKVLSDFSNAEDLIEVTHTYPDGDGGPYWGADSGPSGGAGPLGGSSPADAGPLGGGGVTTEEVSVPRSDRARGLALAELNVSKNYDGLLARLLNKAQQIYFLSIAFDLSDKHKPQIMPPKELSGNTFLDVRRGESFKFTLGEGAPIFLPRQIVGGLGTYIQVVEADDIDKAGDTIQKIHDDLTDDSVSFIDKVKKLISNPASEATSQVLAAGFSLLKPIGTILKANEDDHVGLIQGTFPAKKSWDGRLIQYFSEGSFVRLREITE